MKIHKLVIVLALAAGLVGCSGGTAPDGGDGSAGGDGGGGGNAEGGGHTTSLPDACTLVTRAEIETAVGGTVAEGAVSGPSNHYALGEGAQCVFVPDDGMVGDTWVTVFRATDESWSTYVADETEAFGSEPLTGLGDEAIVDVAQIALRSGDFAVTLQFGMYDPNGPGQRERMVAVAQSVIGRLPQS